MYINPVQSVCKNRKIGEWKEKEKAKILYFLIELKIK